MDEQYEGNEVFQAQKVHYGSVPVLELQVRTYLKQMTRPQLLISDFLMFFLFDFLRVKLTYVQKESQTNKPSLHKTQLKNAIF